MSKSIEKKYEFTGETKEVGVHTLHRIRAVRSFGEVDKGALGGWIEKGKNLSHAEDCWVGDEACVFGDAKVFGNACVHDNARVSGNAHVHGDSIVSGHAEVYGNARVYDNARVCNRSVVYGNARVYGNAWVINRAQVSDTATICGNARVDGAAEIIGDAKVKCNADYTVIKNFWSSGRWITYTHSNGMWKVGCFYGTGKELIEKAYKDSEKKGKCYEAFVRAVEIAEKIS